MLPLAACGGAVTSAKSPAASPPPSWLPRLASAEAKQWGDTHPTAAYWGPAHTPRKAYVIVLVGDYSKAYRVVSFAPGSEPSPLPPVKWLSVEVSASEPHHVSGYGVFIRDFDASQHPDLQPLGL